MGPDRGDWRAEAWVMADPEGPEFLGDLETSGGPGRASLGFLGRWRARIGADRVAGGLRVAEGRRRGSDKFPLARSMWLTPIAAEQATSGRVARHKASRFAERGWSTAVDLCGGIGGDALALADLCPGGVVAIDLDPGMARRLAWNASVHGVADRILAVTARAESLAWPDGWPVHVDPDRRSASSPGRRARAIDDYAPDRAFLESLATHAPGGAIKIGPASDFESLIPRSAREIEVVSLSGECKEATVWFGALAGPVRIRATTLPSGASWTDRDGPSTPAPTCDVGAFLHEPDPALIRSGLLDGFAAAHGLGRIDPRIAYLTGPALPPTPWLSSFRVLEVLPLDRRRIRAALRSAGAASVEIKSRGIAGEPDRWRRDVLPESGPGPSVTLLLVGGGHPRAVLATRKTTEPRMKHG